MNHRKVKIICTLGPSSSSYEIIKKLAESGMNVARLNFSHGSHDDHLRNIKTVRQVSRDLNIPIGILQDLQGPKIRVRSFENGQITLKDGDRFTLTTRDIKGNREQASVSYPSFHEDVKSGDMVLLDDGLLRLQVEKISGQDVQCKVIFGGILKNKKGLNLPGSILSVDALTAKDREDLEFGLKNNVDFVALSFVQKPDDIRMIKDIIASHGKNTPVVAKIEKPQAVHAIEEITDITDVIMVARGDLGVEVNAEEVPPIQKQIIRTCNRKGIPVITATQMLESMITNPRPTRAEASDVANAVLDGTDAVMLSGETAAGKFPVESLCVMDRTVSLIEKSSLDHWVMARRRIPDFEYPSSLAIGYAACHAADLVKAEAIVCKTQSGSTAQMIARYRPNKPIIAITNQEETLARLTLVWGVTAFRVPDFKDNIDDATTDTIGFLKEKSVLKSGDRFVLTAGLPFVARRKTNMLRIERVD